MKTLLILIIAVIWSISSFGQEVELCGSLNTSTEQRFQNAYGIGLQYQHDLGQKIKIGFGIHYNSNNVNFDNNPYIDADPINVVTERINSTSQRFSFRLNIQRLFKNTEYASISLGPEISYNYLWGQDQIDKRVAQQSNRYNFTENNGLTRKLGIGLISNFEIKDFISPQLSLCLTVRPEIIIDGKFAKGEEPTFSGIIGFTEFQIGLKYRFKK